MQEAAVLYRLSDMKDYLLNFIAILIKFLLTYIQLKGVTFLYLLQPVSEEQQSGEDFGYVVAFRPLGSSTWIQTVLASPDASRYIYKNDSIAPLSQFEVKVGVYNSMGEGQFSRVVKVFSAEEGK